MVTTHERQEAATPAALHVPLLRLEVRAQGPVPAVCCRLRHAPRTAGVPVTAADEIRAAIEKLEELKESTRYFEVNGWLCEGQPGDTVRDYFHPDGGASPLTNDPVIVTLHRTIDAQLAILRRDVDMYEKFAQDRQVGVWRDAVERGGDLALARAINGVTS